MGGHGQIGAWSVKWRYLYLIIIYIIKYIAMLEGKKKENSKFYISKHQFLHIEMFVMKSLLLLSKLNIIAT